MRRTDLMRFVLLATLFAVAAPLRADFVTTTPYEVAFSESAAVLMHPNDPGLAIMAGATSGHVLSIERSEPYVLLTNTSSSSLSSSIIQYDMTIGDTADHFTFAELISADSAKGVSMTVVQGTGDQVQLDFSGLAPGESVMFRLGLAPNTGNDYADYQHVFFNNGSGGSGNAVTTVTFDNPAVNSSLTPLTLTDQTSLAATATAASLADCCGANRTPVTEYSFDPGATTVNTNPGNGNGNGNNGGGSGNLLTPEPSSIVLLALGLAGLAVVGWGKRRAMLQPIPVVVKK